MDALTAVRSVSLMVASSAASWVVETVEMKAALKAVLKAGYLAALKAGLSDVLKAELSDVRMVVQKVDLKVDHSG